MFNVFVCEAGKNSVTANKIFVPSREAQGTRIRTLSLSKGVTAGQTEWKSECRIIFSRHQGLVSPARPRVKKKIKKMLIIYITS